jgi:protein transport protein SEC13
MAAVAFETGHQDTIHDTQLDYYGRVRTRPLCARCSVERDACAALASALSLTWSRRACAQRLATCSSDRVIKIWELSGEQRTQLADLTGHEGPVRRAPFARACSAACAASRVPAWRAAA